jgi:hypothetical protein
LKTKLFLATLRVLKRNVPAFFLLSREFPPKLEGRPIFPTRFNAFIWNGFIYAAVQRGWEMDCWGGGGWGEKFNKNYELARPRHSSSC